MGSFLLVSDCRKVWKVSTANSHQCSQNMENIAHILQECPQHCDVQLLWDTTILQLQEHLLDNDMDLAIIEDSSTRLDAWCHQKPPPSPLTPPANQAQTSPGTILLPQLESQQANYYKQKNFLCKQPGQPAYTRSSSRMPSNNGTTTIGSCINCNWTESRTSNSISMYSNKIIENHSPSILSTPHPISPQHT